MSPTLHHNDLPAGLNLTGDIAIDTETTGLSLARDRLCLVQLQDEAGSCHLVKFDGSDFSAPNLKALLLDEKRTKILHFARYDLAMIYKWLGVWMKPVYCTKVASKLVRTYTDRHGLKDLTREIMGVDMNKQQQSSDWAAENLSPEQLNYAASDVTHLHELRRRLDVMLKREKRVELARQCFEFLPARAELDLNGWAELDIFQH